MDAASEQERSRSAMTMNRKPQQAKRAGRSNMYSESKCTNWAPFDPYQGERAAMPRNLAPSATFRISDSEIVRIYERPIHEAFMRPFAAADVVSVLETVPPESWRGCARSI
jgi:hypothetical protein